MYVQSATPPPGTASYYPLQRITNNGTWNSTAYKKNYMGKAYARATYESAVRGFPREMCVCVYLVFPRNLVFFVHTRAHACVQGERGGPHTYRLDAKRRRHPGRIFSIREPE